MGGLPAGAHRCGNLRRVRHRELGAGRSYKGDAGPEYDELIDTIAAVCAADDPDAITNLYDSDDLTVPTALLQ